MNHREEGWAKHCERVGALARRVGECLNLNAADLQALADAARWHHSPVHLMNRGALSRLLRDVFETPSIDIGHDPKPISERARQVLLRLHGANAPEDIVRLAEIITIADALDQELEMEPYGLVPRPNALWDSPFVEAAVAQLRRASLADLRAVIPRLPVFAPAALEALRLLLYEGMGVDDLCQIGLSDPVYASHLIGSANSARNNPRSPLRTVRQAISYIGAPQARRVLLEATVQPLFTPQRMRPVWRHSLECARIAADLAKTTRLLPVVEGYLAGLVHDIGALAISLLDVNCIAACDRLCDLGCSQASSEWVTFGFTHAEASAEVLQAYQFPADIVEAVRLHHAPEQGESALAALLYVAEFWSSADEDLPSAVRLQRSLNRLGMSAAALRRIEIPA